jgi:hypothetical protein
MAEALPAKSGTLSAAKDGYIRLIPDPQKARLFCGIRSHLELAAAEWCTVNAWVG